MSKASGIVTAAIAAFAVAAQPATASQLSECTETVALEPAHEFQFTTPGIGDYNLTLTLDMDEGTPGAPGGDDAYRITSLLLDGGDTVTDLAPGGELLLVMSEDGVWSFSYLPVNDPAADGGAPEQAALDCNGAQDVPI